MKEINRKSLSDDVRIIFIVFSVGFLAVSIIGLFVAKLFLYGVPGDLSRWLTFATLIQATVASSAIFGVSIAILIYAKKADETLDRQTDAHEQNAIISITDKIEKIVSIFANNTLEIRNNIMRITVALRACDGDQKKISEAADEISNETKKLLQNLYNVSKQGDITRVVITNIKDLEKSDNAAIKQMAKLTLTKALSIKERFECLSKMEGGNKEIAFIDYVRVMETSARCSDKLLTDGLSYPLICVLFVLNKSIVDYTSNTIESYCSHIKDDQKRKDYSDKIRMHSPYIRELYNNNNNYDAETLVNDIYDCQQATSKWGV
ncbi:MAG: hypothetical protein ACP5VS_14870 [Desulfomonilaceae bacterium]